MRYFAIALYNLLFPLAMLVMLPGQWVKMRRRGGYGENWRERFGVYAGQSGGPASGGCWWVHAVSVGEMLMALKLIDGLRRSGVWTGPVAVTTTTSTGRRLAKERADAQTTVLWTPLDLPWVARRALRHIQPRRIILVEAEVWPNLLTRATAAGVPVSVVNARLSARSERRFRRFRALVAPVFSLLSDVCVQDDADVGRFAAIGVPRDRLCVTGAIKFDEEGENMPPPGIDAVHGMLGALPALAGRRLILAASTHPGEEAVMARAWLGLRENYPDTAMVFVPRHFERAADAARDLAALGLSPVMRSAFRADGFTPPAEADCLVIDSTGELRAWYAVASLVIVGKSFAGQAGGQNPAEPVRAGHPVITGPRMDNFRQLMHTLTAADGIRQLKDDAELPAAMDDLLARPDEAAAMARRGFAALARHDGATRRTIARLAAGIPGRP